MTTEKEMLVKSLNVLVENAEDISNLARAQRVGADKQHESAHKLEKLSHALEDGATQIKDELAEKGVKGS